MKVVGESHCGAIQGGRRIEEVKERGLYSSDSDTIAECFLWVESAIVEDISSARLTRPRGGAALPCLLTWNALPEAGGPDDVSGGIFLHVVHYGNLRLDASWTTYARQHYKPALIAGLVWMGVAHPRVADLSADATFVDSS